jgi:hypothetical protein
MAASLRMTRNEMGLCSEVKMVRASLRIAVEMKAGIQGATSRKERGEWGNRAATSDIDRGPKRGA